MNILFTICGRAGSKGLKNKNLKSFLNYPLPFYTLSAIDLFMKNTKQFLCDIVLNTDSKELITLFEKRSFIPVNIIERTPELSGDDTPKIDVIRNSYFTMKDRLSINYDMVIDLDITSPLRTLSNLEDLVSQRIVSDADVIFSVTDSRRNPYFNMVMKTDKGYERVIKSSFNARQEAPEIFDMNASMYAFSPRFLNSSQGLFDGKCEIIKMKDTAVLDIDSEQDFIFMEIIADYLYKTSEDYKEIQDNIPNVLSGV